MSSGPMLMAQQFHMQARWGGKARDVEEDCGVVITLPKSITDSASHVGFRLGASLLTDAGRFREALNAGVSAQEQAPSNGAGELNSPL